MKKNKEVAEAEELRRRAEGQLQANWSETEHSRTDSETLRLLHELQVHQIELELQNAELRQGRDALESLLVKYADLYDFAPVGYVSLDGNGTIGAVNLAGASILGIDRSRLLGQRFSLLVTDDSYSVFTEFFAKVMASQTRESCELALLKNVRQPFFVQLEAIADGARQECRMVIIDISVRRKMEDVVEVLNTDLAARSAELEVANLELEAFNFSVSHDLRSPLTTINSYCQVILEQYGASIDQECLGYVREVYDGTLRMNRLIDTLLDFSRVSRVEMQREKVDLSKIARDQAMYLNTRTPDRRVTFTIAAGVVVEGDESLLRIVLDNLMGNAWKYTASREEGEIEFGERKLEGNMVYFVRDNGSGFNMSFSDTLFKPFKQIPGTNIEGHGIGLATVDRIIRRHGGRVWAESDPGRGATFMFTLQP